MARMAFSYREKITGKIFLSVTKSIGFWSIRIVLFCSPVVINNHKTKNIVLFGVVYLSPG